jgi:glycosyltransferase involved in cell wall biosynthesis
MKVYHISSAPFTGGAARAGFRLHEGLLQEPGIESTWLDCSGGARGLGVLALGGPTKPASLSKRIRRRNWANIVSRHFSPTTPPASNPIGWGSIEMLEKLPVPDIWNLHWVSWFLDWETMLPWMAERAPIVWTLHDLNPLKGIWHYEPLAGECTPRRMALEAKSVDLKRRALGKVPRNRLTFVGPSRWMVDACRKSPVTEGFRTEHIPYGLDTEIFCPRDSAVLRNMYGISEDALVIGFIADNLSDPRKGMRSLQSALQILSRHHPDFQLITVGKGSLQSGGLRHTHLGPLNDDTLLSYFYAACDLFVCPSLQDNLPNTVIESLACGTPVLGYKTGGIPDMVQHGHNGGIVEQIGSAEDFSRALIECLSSRELLGGMKVHSRETAIAKYDESIQARNYTRTYSTIARK